MLLFLEHFERLYQFRNFVIPKLLQKNLFKSSKISASHAILHVKYSLFADIKKTEELMILSHTEHSPLN